MAGFSKYLSQAIINGTLVNHTWPASVTLYLALFTASPTDANDDPISGNEVSTGTWTSYVRKATGAWSAPTVNATANTGTITFDAVAGSSVTITHWAIYDGTGGGANMLYSGSLTGGAKTLSVGDVLTVAPGDLTITVD